MKIIHYRDEKLSISKISTASSGDNNTITITLLYHTDNSQLHFTAQPNFFVRDFLEQILNKFAQGENAARIEQLRNNYEPVLEVLINGESIELKGDQTLAEAGIGNNAVCQIAARPLKEKLMFCRYASQA